LLIDTYDSLKTPQTKQVSIWCL